MPVDVDAATAALDKLAADLIEATRDAVGDGAEWVRMAARAEAPMQIGTLKASIIVDGPRLSATVSGLWKAAPRGPGSFAAKVGPTVVYGRIREIGGRIPGRGHAMTHPYLRWFYMGRPVFRHVVGQKGSHYMLKAYSEFEPQFRGMCIRRWSNAINSV